MAEHRSSSRWSSALVFLLGPTLGALFYGALWVLPPSLAHRYFMGHPVAYAATFLFFIAVAALSIRWLAATSELRALTRLTTDQLKPSNFDSEETMQMADTWLLHLRQLSHSERGSLIVNRIRETVTRQQRRGNAKLLNDDLREIADRDADAAHDSLQLVRIVVWAIPMLGFLGTVIGITQTLGGLDFTDAQNAVDKLKAGLYVAFDTTALGLVLSVIAIFLQFPVEKTLGELNAILDDRTGGLLAGTFPERIPADEPLHAIAEMNRAVLASVSKLVETQADLWKNTVDSAHEHWASVVGTAGDQIQSALAQAIDESLSKHASHVAGTQAEAAARTKQQWEEWQETLSENGKILLAQQQALAEQNQFLSDTSTRAEEVTKLQGLLTDQTSKLGDVNNLSHAMLALARAVDALNERTASLDSRRRAA